MSSRRVVLASFLMISLAACGDDDGGGTIDANTPTIDAGTSDAGGGYTNLITADWSLAAGTEMYQCTRFTATRDMYLSEIRPVAPLGTHHTVLSLATAGAVADGTYECTDPFEFGNLGIIYGSGLGSLPFVFPTGIATKISAGQQIHINLHLFNTGDTTLTGTSGIDIKEVALADVQHEARADIWGQPMINLPTGPSTVSGPCVVASGVTMFAVQPHMHQLGTHFKLTNTPAGGAETMLYDEDYSFDTQEHRLVTPFLELAAGDTLGVECTYDNTTGMPVTFGESTRNEMCFAVTWIYPANVALCQ